MVRLADYVVDTLFRHGVRHVFLVTGGGAMHLNDAIGRQPGLSYVCCHHEQACAMAAEAYARVSNRIGVVNVTTGPGGINALNGVYGAYTDSIPMLVVSGQVKRETLLATHHLTGKLRQLGDQEVDIVAMVRGITKYAVMIDNPADIRYHLERALHLAASGRRALLDRYPHRRPSHAHRPRFSPRLRSRRGRPLGNWRSTRPMPRSREPPAPS